MASGRRHETVGATSNPPAVRFGLFQAMSLRRCLASAGGTPTQLLYPPEGTARGRVRGRSVKQHARLEGLRRIWDHASIQLLLRQTLNNGQLMPFGTFASGIYLPTADMDLVFVSPNFLSGGQPSLCQCKTSLYKPGRALMEGESLNTARCEL